MGLATPNTHTPLGNRLPWQPRPKEKEPMTKELEGRQDGLQSGPRGTHPHTDTARKLTAAAAIAAGPKEKKAIVKGLMAEDRR